MGREQDDSELFNWLKARYSDCAPAANKRAVETRKMRDVYNAQAWKALDGKNAQEGADSKLIECNLIAPYLNAVLGAQLQGNRTTAFIAKSVDSNISADTMNQAYDWFKDQADMGRNISAAFRDCVVSGMGFVELGLDFTKAATGEPFAERIDPLEMVLDKRAKQTNLRDMRYAFRLTKLTIRELKAQFPDISDQAFGFSEAGEPDDNRTGNMVEQARGIWPLAGDQDVGDGESGDDRRVWLCEARWLEPGEAYWLNVHSWQVLPPKQYEAAKQAGRLAGQVWIKRHKTRTRRAYLGSSEFLQAPDEPLCKPGTLGWEAITCYRNDGSGQYYGMVSNAVDLQMQINKYLSIMNKVALSSAKGGIIVEEGALGNVEDFERNYAKAGTILYVPKGSIEKIRDQPQPRVPETLKENLQLALDLLPRVMGISPEFLGLVERDQPNVLEQTRRKSTLNILAEVFDNLRQMRIALAEQAGFIIQNFVPNGVLMRTVNKSQVQFVPFIRKAVADIDYSVEVDEVDNSLTDKQTVWANATQITQMLVQYAQSGAPMELPKVLLNYAPLPASLITEMEAIITQWEQGQQQAQASQAQAQAGQMQAQQAQMQAEQGQKQAELAGKMQVEQGKLADAAAEREMRGKELQLEAAKQATLAEGAAHDTQIKAQTELAKARLNAAVKLFPGAERAPLRKDS